MLMAMLQKILQKLLTISEMCGTIGHQIVYARFALVHAHAHDKTQNRRLPKRGVAMFGIFFAPLVANTVPRTVENRPFFALPFEKNSRR
jgi:hypothetical protein